MTMSQKTIYILVLLALTLFASPVEQFFEEAERATHSGDYALALQKLELARQDGFDGARLHYNLGNIHARLGHHGLAIGHYLKAQEEMPGSLELRNNLNYVRSLRKDRFETAETTRVLKTIFFWHYDIPWHLRLRCLLWPMPLLFLCAAILLWKRPAWLRWSLLALLCWCLAFGISTGLSSYQRSHSTRAVVAVAETHPRKGDGENYANAFSAPIHDGTELVVLRSRGGWSQIQLPNGLSGWLPDTDIFFI